MADEEKNTSAEIDDWLDDFEEADKTGAQIDQSDIDEALLGNNDEDLAAAAPPTEAAEQDGPIDQSAIDALLGGDAPAATPEPEVNAGGDAIDQSDIDALLSGGDDTPAATPEPEVNAGGDAIDQSDIDALLSGGGDTPAATPEPEVNAGGDAIDQSDIDALLSGGGDTPAATPEPEVNAGGDAIDQSEIDALLSGDVDTPATTPEPELNAGDDAIDQSEIDALLGGDDQAVDAASADDSGPVSQNDIDALFGENDASDANLAPDNALESLAANGDESIDQSEIDDLFGDMDGGTVSNTGSQDDDIDQLFNDFNEEESAPKDKSFKSEEVDFTELLDEDKGDDESFTLGEEDFGLSAEDFTLGTEEPITAGETVDANALFNDDEATQALPDFLADGPVGEETITSMSEHKASKTLPILAMLKNKKVMGAAAMLSLALLVGGYFYLHPNKKPAITMSELVPETAAPPEEVNTLPQAVAADYKMPTKGGELAILLTAADKEDDPLTFEITNAPAHGRISGEPPQITYLPNNNFPGEDRFTFLVSDGQGASEPADIVISGPNLAAPPPTMAMTEKPKATGTTAKNITISMRSTESLDLDWRKIWAEANSAPFGKNVSVQILGKDLHGQLSKVNPTRYRYQPDPYFSGRESITYRFKMGKTYSPKRKVRLMMAKGTPPPQVQVSPLAKTYQVGEVVTIDASASRDENRATLHFNWEQTGGTPIRIKKMNEEGSIISFVVPSSFYTAAASSSGPKIMVTAIDDDHQVNQRQITINTVSRQRAALWRGGSNGSSIAVEPGCPQGRCPGEMLPWPYPN